MLLLSHDLDVVEHVHRQVNARCGEPLSTLATFWDRDILQFVLTGLVLFGLGLVGDLFLDPVDVVLSADLLWENYNLCWETRLGAHFHYFTFFDEKLTGFDPQVYIP